MKRILTICIFILGTLSVFAQAERPERSIYIEDTTRYLSSTLKQNWFASVSGNINWWQGSDRNPAGNYTSLNGPTFGTEVAFGKWITHNIALRLAYDSHRAHSFINGPHTELTNLQFLFKYNPTPDENGYYPTSFMYHNLHVDAMVSLTDLFLGYYEDRFYTPIVFAGMGIACVSEHYFLTQTFIEDGFKKNRNFERSANIGLINSFKMNKKFELQLTAMLTGTRFSIDTWTSGEYGVGASGEEPRPRAVDLNYAMALGVNWNFSGNDVTGNRIYELPINYSNEKKAMRERIKNLEDELDECLKSKPTDTIIQFVNTGTGTGITDTIMEYVTYPFSIFFERDSYEFMSRRELVNLNEIAKVAVEKGWKIRLRGSCDSATATAAYNQQLSERRCNTVLAELLKMDVPEDQVIIVPVGGVHELNPTEYDRRVIIELVKEIK